MYNGHILTDTMLHMDMTNAINISIHMEGKAEEGAEYWSDDEPHAVWLLWRREDVEPLRNYLRQYFHLGLDDDPINLGNLRISPTMFPDFEAREILPYMIRQRVGQAVIIPALTPHYVRFYRHELFIKLILLYLRSLTWLTPLKSHVTSCLSKTWSPQYK